MRPRHVFCKVMRVPAFVPPILILINVYVIMRQNTCSVERDTIKIRSALIGRETQLQEKQELVELTLNNQKRLSEIQQVCRKYNNDDTFSKRKMYGEGLFTPTKSILYCVVPKVGCTTWKQIFRFISHDYEGRPVSKPSDIDRIYAHFGPWNKTTLYNLGNGTQLGYANKADFKFMFARDPYARLWSGYLDKLFLPDFWWWLGTKIIAEVRPNADELSKHCGHTVTFSEFLEFTASQLKKNKHVDMHFEPVYYRCNPCQMNFDVVGKMETFASDTNLIKSGAKIARDSVKTGPAVDRNLLEIQMLTTYNFDIQKRLTKLGKKFECYNQVEIAKRLWKTFQYNGYLGEDVQFPEEEFANMDSAELIKESILSKLTAIRKNTPAAELKRWNQQRMMYLKKAYSGIPMQIKKDIQNTYKIDFELFQYNSSPNFVFS